MLINADWPIHTLLITYVGTRSRRLIWRHLYHKAGGDIIQERGEYQSPEGRLSEVESL